MYQTLRRNLVPLGLDLQRIETSVAQGIPDLNYCYQGVEGWIELKKLRRKTKRGVFSIPHLRANQCAWINRRVSHHGGTVWLLAQVDQDLVLIHGRNIYDVYRRRWTWGEIDKFAHVFPAPVDYGALLTTLVG